VLNHELVQIRKEIFFSGFIFADGAIPIVPVQAGPRSDKISPNKFEATTTSNHSGFKTNLATRISI
jgi:hypothetical protein